ncbi:MAG: aldo/keto reductase [Sorangiineae bacterium PRO1]|nr:aldo/keto reductase [Sorangiineae bacterium PRO1]
MDKRSAGQNGPSVTAIGLGCMGMSEFYGASDDARSIEVIHHALDRGVTFLDTADMYGAGKNERLVGQALKARRDEAFLCTKFAVRRGEDGSWLGISGRPEYVAAACDASLARLGVEHIDLYYQHRVDPEVPIEETIGAMAELVKAGKVRWLGMSEAAPETLRRAAKIHPIAALQTELSLWSREPETELLATCRELGTLFVAYSPLGRGFLSGQLRSRADLAADDFRRNLPRFSEEHFAKNLALVKEVETLAARKGCTAAQLALAWVLSRGDHVVAIPGTRSSARLDENAAAAAVTLSAADLAALDAILPPGAAEGTRYSAPGMASVNR